MSTRVLVTGGGGFLGSAIVAGLVSRGDSVRSLSRNRYATLERLGVEQFAGDLADTHAVRRAVDGCELVFHVAAKAGVWGPYRDYYDANVVGTANVIEACLRAGVPRLVYTGTPSVVFDGRDQEAVNESAPYPRRYLAAYPKTKALAEAMVNRANGERLATVSLRPHLIWGPGDNHLIPRILERAGKGRLRLIGSGASLVDSTYIDNAAMAHLLAADGLAKGKPIAGKNYFISNGEPVPMAQLINGIVQAAGLPPVEKRVPASIAYGLGVLLEGAYRLLGFSAEPPMTRFVARQLATAHWFDISAAEKDFGYRPEVSLEAGLARLRDWLRDSRILPGN